MQGGATPGRGLTLDEGPRTMEYICGECHFNQEVKPKVTLSLESLELEFSFRIPSDAESAATESSTKSEPDDWSSSTADR